MNESLFFHIFSLLCVFLNSDLSPSWPLPVGLICWTCRPGRRTNPAAFWGCTASAWWSGCWSCCCCCRSTGADIWRQSSCTSAGATSATSSSSPLGPAKDPSNNSAQHKTLSAWTEALNLGITSNNVIFNEWNPKKTKTSKPHENSGSVAARHCCQLGTYVKRLLGTSKDAAE